MEPAVMTFTFNVTVPETSTVTHYIDLSQCASITNRRFYRQGINWPVAGIKLLSTPVLNTGSLNGSLRILKLPETWVMENAYTKSFNAWMEMNEKALEDEQESLKPRFMDFKIYADSGHHTAGFDANLLPVNSVGAAATPGEWESSKIVVPTSITAGTVNSFELIATGANFPGASAATGINAVSLVEGYAASRALPYENDPNTPLDANDVGPTAEPENWMGAMRNEGTGQTSAVITDNTTENDQAPYPYEGDGTATDTQYPGGANQLPGLQIHDLDFITGTTIGGTTRSKGGMFPCGLIALTFTNLDEVACDHTIQIDMIPGDHRGYLCEPMV